MSSKNLFFSSMSSKNLNFQSEVLQKLELLVRCPPRKKSVFSAKCPSENFWGQIRFLEDIRVRGRQSPKRTAPRPPIQFFCIEIDKFIWELPLFIIQNGIAFWSSYSFAKKKRLSNFQKSGKFSGDPGEIFRKSGKFSGLRSKTGKFPRYPTHLTALSIKLEFSATIY